MIDWKKIAQDLRDHIADLQAQLAAAEARVARLEQALIGRTEKGRAHANRPAMNRPTIERLAVVLCDLHNGEGFWDDHASTKPEMVSAYKRDAAAAVEFLRSEA